MRLPHSGVPAPALAASRVGDLDTCALTSQVPLAMLCRCLHVHGYTSSTRYQTENDAHSSTRPSMAYCIDCAAAPLGSIAVTSCWQRPVTHLTATIASHQATSSTLSAQANQGGMYATDHFHCQSMLLPSRWRLLPCWPSVGLRIDWFSAATAA